MGYTTSEKSLNIPAHILFLGSYRIMTKKELAKEIVEAQKDPSFVREIKRFIKASMTVYKLN